MSPYVIAIVSDRHTHRHEHFVKVFTALWQGSAAVVEQPTAWTVIDPRGPITGMMDKYIGERYGANSDDYPAVESKLVTALADVDPNCIEKYITAEIERFTERAGKAKSLVYVAVVANAATAEWLKQAGYFMVGIDTSPSRTETTRMSTFINEYVDYKLPRDMRDMGLAVADIYRVCFAGECATD